MKKITNKFIAALLSIVMIASMLPAASASSTDLRSAVVNQVQAMMDVDWTQATRIARTDVKTDVQINAFKDAGIRPTVYFEYKRMQLPLKGMLVSTTPGSFEQFLEQLDMSQSVVEGIPHHAPESSKPDANGITPYYGMTMHSFLVDVISRVSPTAPLTFKDALTHESLTALLSGADVTAASSKAAIGSNLDGAKAAYSKLAAGDILLAWDDNAVVGKPGDSDDAVDPTMHALVVKEVNGDQVTVMYRAYSEVVWYFQCEKCGVVDLEGPTASACPVHVESSKSYAFKRFYSHKDTYPESGCTGLWSPMYGTAWRTETVSYDALLGENDASVPYGSAGYLPYTLTTYTTGAPAADVKVESNADASNINGGFSAKVSSNYRIVAIEAVLTAEDGTVQRFPSVVADWKAWSWDYSDSALNTALMNSKSGKYKLELYATTGPADASGKTPSVLGYTLEVGLDSAAIELKTSKSALVQGEGVTVSLNAQKDGLTAIKTNVDYDPDFFTFDEAASKAASPNTTFVDNGEAGIAVRYAGPATVKGATPVTLYFTAKRTGDHAVKEGIAPFQMLDLFTSTVAGAADDQLKPDRADGIGDVTVGYNTVLYKDYAAGNDLLLVFMSHNDISLVKKTTLPMLYDGKLMDEVTQSHYTLDGSSYLVIFGYIGPDLDPLLVSRDESSGATNSPEIVYNNDVNQSANVDINDAQTIANIYNGKLPVAGNTTSWLRADVNRDGKVDAKDRNALFVELRK